MNFYSCSINIQFDVVPTLSNAKHKFNLYQLPLKNTLVCEKIKIWAQISIMLIG